MCVVCMCDVSVRYGCEACGVGSYDLSALRGAWCVVMCVYVCDVLCVVCVMCMMCMCVYVSAVCMVCNV